MPQTMHTPSPEEIGNRIMTALKTVVEERNQRASLAGNPNKLGLTIQFDDPKKPDMIQIELDKPAPESNRAKDVILAHVEINKKSGKIYFIANEVTPADGEVYKSKDYSAVLACMTELVWQHQ